VIAGTAHDHESFSTFEKHGETQVDCVVFPAELQNLEVAQKRHTGSVMSLGCRWRTRSDSESRDTPSALHSDVIADSHAA
jgi:hypothetical protein